MLGFHSAKGGRDFGRATGSWKSRVHLFVAIDMHVTVSLSGDVRSDWLRRWNGSRGLLMSGRLILYWAFGVFIMLVHGEKNVKDEWKCLDHIQV